MLTEPQKLWVAALRSGEFKQTTEALKAGNSYCCLGVACVLAKRQGVIPKNTRWVDDSSNPMECLDEQFTPVKEWLRLHDESGNFIYNSLAGLNDHGIPFPQIANIIESEPHGLFNPPTA